MHTCKYILLIVLPFEMGFEMGLRHLARGVDVKAKCTNSLEARVSAAGPYMHLLLASAVTHHKAALSCNLQLPSKHIQLDYSGTSCWTHMLLRVGVKITLCFCVFLFSRSG